MFLSFPALSLSGENQLVAFCERFPREHPIFPPGLCLILLAMESIKEDLLHFIWENRMFDNSSLSVKEEKVEVIDTGQHNKASGPDFFNARIKIGNTQWAGNVEIHVKASDWFRHNHHGDPAYFNVILHVVYEQDCRLERPGGEEIPCLVLKFEESLIENYNRLIKTTSVIPCQKFLQSIDKIYWSDWYSKLMIGRLEEKTLEIERVLSANKYNWEDCLYHFLGRSFGFKINALPFETLVRTTPLNVLLRLRQKSLTLNAILFGQAGFLEDLLSEDEYYVSLQREYQPMMKTLPSRAIDKSNWKFMGARPGNFPLVRIAQFASVIVKRYPLFAQLTDHPDLKSWRKILEPGIEPYWESHYLFGKTGKKRKLRMGKMAVDLVILNAFIPIVFHYGTFRRRGDLKDRVLSILEELPSEKNDIIKKWEEKGVKSGNAFESQALIHLTTRFCKQRKCLECMIGNRIIKAWDPVEN